MAIKQLQDKDLSLIPKVWRKKVAETINLLIGSANSNTPAGVKTYKALLSQSGTAAPTIESNGSGANTPLENTIGSIVWTRGDEGYYVGTLAGAFPQDKTFFSIQKQGLLATNTLTKSEEVIRWSDVDSIIIITTDGTGGALSGSTDSILNFHSVLIEVYP